MTSTAAIVVALSLIINEINLIYDSKILKEEHPESKLMFLLSACLLMKKVSFVPRFVWRKLHAVCSIIEIPLSLIILESALFHVWTPLKDYLLFHSDDLLVHLYEHMKLEWVICPLCCGKNDCSHAFATLVLKVMSFTLLLTICFVAKK